MHFQQLIQSINILPTTNPDVDFSVQGLSCNSAQVKKGFIFVAIKGSCQDGHNFIKEAIARGAAAIVAQSFAGITEHKDVVFVKVQDTRQALARLAIVFYGNPSKQLKVVGVTGTNGKTTVTYLLEALLSSSGHKPAVIGTINYRFTGKQFPSKNTTPGPDQLQAILADFQKQGSNYVAMEVSSHALEQGRVEGVNFGSAIFTNLTQDHLDYHLNLDNYFQAKAKLFKQLEKDSFAVINNDDEYATRILGLTRAKVISYGIENNSDFMAYDITLNPSSVEFKVKSPGLAESFKLGLIGMHNVYNALAAIAWAVQAGIKLPEIKLGLENFNLVPGRLERIDSGAGFSVFIDYAHTEDALKNVLVSLRQIRHNKIIVVFGCGGDRDKTKRPKMGSVVSELADYAVITNDNPRSEEPGDIIRSIRSGMKNGNCEIIPDRMDAIRKSLSLAQEGDMVLIAGKGHENYQIIKNRVLHFDDREAVRECLKSLNY